MKELGTAAVQKDELSKLPYLSHIPKDGRIVPIQTYYDHANGQWLTWIVHKGALQQLRCIDLCHGMYVSTNPVSPDTDYPMPFAEIILRHFCTPKISDRMHQASQDLINCLGYIEKYFILLNHARKFKGTNASTLLQIELEGVFGIHRSYYDILQRVVNEVYERYSMQKVKLPYDPSFRKFVQKEPDELMGKYHFPAPLVQFYQEKKPLFSACRQIRDNVFHHGHSFGSIFTFDDGFAVGVDERPWNILVPIVNLWPDERLRNNRLGSVLVVFALLAEDMFKTMAWLGEAILASFQEPPTAIFTSHVYLRTNFACHLHKLSDYERIQWVRPEDALPEMTEKI